MLLHALLKIAETASLGAEGATLFIGVAPVAATGAAIFVQQGGAARDYAPGLHRLDFQVFNRDLDYPTAYARSEAIAAALTLRQSTVSSDLGGYHVYACNPRHEPLCLGREESGVFTFVVNYRADWRAA